MTRSMIFHHPLPITDSGTSGSSVRPKKMLDAFSRLGYSVETVSGYGKERSAAIKRIVREIKSGRVFDFLYSESSTMPTLLTERHHMPIYPTLDFGFFQFLRRNYVPIGLFYRDIYWRFPFYRKQVSWLKRTIAIINYRYDWWQYQRKVDHLFLPSAKMKAYLPVEWPADRCSQLPPGCDLIPVTKEQSFAGDEGRILRLFYVGGVMPPLYDLRPTMHLLRDMENMHLTLCCRREEWSIAKKYYEEVMPSNITIVHASGAQLLNYYQAADVFLICRAGNKYLDFALPVKVLEALGYALPIVTLRGSEASRFIEAEGTGWVVSSLREMRELLEGLCRNRERLEQKRVELLNIRKKHTWETRAMSVAETLSRYKESIS